MDGLVIGLVLLGASWAWDIPFNSRYLALAGITFILMLVVFPLVDLYRPWRGRNPARLAGRIFLAWILVIAILAGLAFITKTSSDYSRAVALFWVATAPLALIGLRFLVYSGLAWLRAKGFNTRRVVIAGAGDLGRRLAEKLVDTPWMGLQLLSFFDDRLAGKIMEIGSQNIKVPVLAPLDDMVEFVRQSQVDMVYLALPLRAEQRLRKIIDNLQDTTASVYFVPDVFIFSLLQAGSSEVGGLPLISLWETPFYGLQGFLKRSLDLALASLLLLCSLPLLVFIALGVKLSSPGPVFFQQRRYGLDGREILIYKFRSMSVCEDGPKVPQSTRNDSRVTRFGAFLRKTSLDELPQLINVLRGSMSIVGPRPHAVAHNEFYRRRIPSYMLRHKVLPGLTGWAQINGWRGETETIKKMEKRIEHDLYYMSNWSIWLDLKIIFLTSIRFLRDPHAY